MIQHFVTFYSPGTFCSETSTRPVTAWNTDEAVALVHDIKERHGATPFGFRFTTRERGEADLDSKETKSSAMYYLGGIVETLEQVKARAAPEDSILVSNMEINKYNRIITNTNSYKFTIALNDDDIVLDFVK